LYLPFRVPRGTLATFLKEFEQLPVEGYSVTIPHKESAFAAARVKDPNAQVIQASNTLVRRDDGFHAYNTDAPAAIASLNDHLPTDAHGKQATLANMTVMILGAGGVARAVAHGLAREGSRLVITNRTAERAQHLAEEVGHRYVVWPERQNVQCDLVVNCTSVGMHPNMDEMPIHASYLKPGLMVFDTIYTPETTLLVKEARARGCHVLTGVDMFVRQAALQFELFTGTRPPLEFMAEEVRKAISPLSWRGEA
jgi:3-dehydroquinate dehydratase/shikimate dehydrogenase